MLSCILYPTNDSKTDANYHDKIIAVKLYHKMFTVFFIAALRLYLKQIDDTG